MRPSKQTVLTALAVVAIYILLEVVRRTGVINPYWAQVMDLALIMTISAVGLSLIFGFSGQLALGHAAFYGIGAYTAGIVTKSWGDSYFLFAVALIAGTVAAGLAAYLIGKPILRLRDDYLGIATLGFGIIVKVLLDNTDKISSAFGGPRGMLGIPQMSNFAWIFWLAVLAILLARNLVQSSFGRASIAVREDDIAADIVGLSATRFKTLMFVVGSAMAGLAGGLYAHRYPLLHPQSFDFLKSVDVLLIVVLGGLGSLTGTVVTAIGWVFLLEGLRDVLPLEWRGVIYALILVVVMVMRPKGLMGGKEFSPIQFFTRKSDAAGPGKGDGKRASA